MIVEAVKLTLLSLVCLAAHLSHLPTSTRVNQTGASAPATIEQLAWIGGDWETEAGKVRIEEHWTRPAGGTMIGMGRTIAQDKTVFFEYLRIEMRPDGIYYVAHPRARAGTDFKLVQADSQMVKFENLAHDFPKRIIYRNNGDGSITARVEGDGTEKEKPQEFRYRRMK